MLEVLFCWYKFSLQDLPALQTFVFQINYTQTEVTPAKTKSTFTPHIPTLDQIIKKRNWFTFGFSSLFSYSSARNSICVGYSELTTFRWNSIIEYHKPCSSFLATGTGMDDNNFLLRYMMGFSLYNYLFIYTTNEKSFFKELNLQF